MIHDLPAPHRRHFLATSLATACGLASRCNANPIEHHALIDTHVYLGKWPLLQLAADEPAELVALLRRSNATLAWAGSFDGVFHKDIHGVNLRLVETCRSAGDGMLVPIGSVNPTLPDWEEDVRRCDEVFKMPGIRLHPSYHGYTLDDPRFARLLELAAARRLMVQLVVRLTDKSHGLLTPRVPHVELAPLAHVVEPIRGVRLLISGGSPSVRDVKRVAFARLPSVYFDFARTPGGDKLRALVDLVSADRVVFGSAAPISNGNEAIKKLDLADFGESQIRAVRELNAQRMIDVGK